jgi:ribosomal protein L7/L12
MDATSLDLKDANEFVASAPVTLKQNLTKAAAEKLRADLQAAGATVAIELQ